MHLVRTLAAVVVEAVFAVAALLVGRCRKNSGMALSFSYYPRAIDALFSVVKPASCRLMGWRVRTSPIVGIERLATNFLEERYDTRIYRFRGFASARLFDGPWLVRSLCGLAAVNMYCPTYADACRPNFPRNIQTAFLFLPAISNNVAYSPCLSAILRGDCNYRGC